MIGLTSGTYPIGKTQCMSVNTGGLKDGDIIDVIVHAKLGDTNTVGKIQYSATSTATVNFVCKGTTLNFHCDSSLGQTLPHDEEKQEGIAADMKDFTKDFVTTL